MSAHIRLISVQAIYTLYSNEGILKLPYCITITGIVCSFFAFGIPHMSALRLWLGVSTLFSLIYIIVAIVLSIKDGNSLPSIAVFVHECMPTYYNLVSIIFTFLPLNGLF
jgi:hypothetical protein